MFEDQIKESEEEKMKAQLQCETLQKEIKSLRDEIRKLHVSKFSLEKIIKDQECKLQLMNTSRESYHLQISQIESQSSRCTQQLTELEEALSSLQDNVKSAVSVNETVRTQNTTYSNQLDGMREESNRLLEKVYKNPLYNQITAREEREQVETVKLRVQNKFAKERMIELENELLSVKSNLSKSNKSLQECHQLICNQSAVSNRKLEEEQKRHEDEKFELERELNEFKNRVITLETEKEMIEEQNSQLQNKDILKKDTRECAIVASEDVLVFPVILCRDSQEREADNEMELSTQVPSIPVKQDIGIHYTQATSDCEDISDKEVTSHTINTNQSQISPITFSPEPPNKRAKLEPDTSQNNSPTPIS
eukprot:TRINITY_DN278_c0_g1_i2.p1 TRINITY_DN278_c0_g1~~TRINITY_DN278_c0_g1_i2.p1  ORF type:complete len:365 (+),score=123.65 TRINITY_DN278_c0_g1_i2:222-1316(+)